MNVGVGRDAWQQQLDRVNVRRNDHRVGAEHTLGRGDHVLRRRRVKCQLVRRAFPRSDTPLLLYGGFQRSQELSPWHGKCRPIGNVVLKPVIVQHIGDVRVLEVGVPRARRQGFVRVLADDVYRLAKCP